MRKTGTVFSVVTAFVFAVMFSTTAVAEGLTHQGSRSTDAYRSPGNITPDMDQGSRINPYYDQDQGMQGLQDRSDFREREREFGEDRFDSVEQPFSTRTAPNQPEESGSGTVDAREFSPR